LAKKGYRLLSHHMANLDQRQALATSRVAPVLVGCLLVAALSLLLPSTLVFDPMTWATWAREIVHLDLHTDGGPAWKPLPVLVDIVSAPFGPVVKWIWLVVARAGGLLAVAMAYRLAHRLAGRWAGAIAAAGMLLSSSFIEYLTPQGMSEPLLAGLALLAIERHLDEKYPHAYGLIFASLLLRPETLPFFVGYSVFMWLRSPRYRPWIVVLNALLPVLWLLPDYLSSGDWLRSSRRAAIPTQGGPLLTGHPGFAVLESGFNTVLLPIVVGAALAMVSVALRYLKRQQDSVVLALSLVCLGWLVEVALVTQLRLGSGDERYLIVSVALACVLAGVGWTRVVAGARTFQPKAIVAVALLASAPFVVQRLDELSSNIGELPYQAHKYGELATLIDAAGGRGAILACGPISSDIYQMPAVAWQLGIHQSQIVITPGPNGTSTKGMVTRTPTEGTVFRTRPTRGAPLLPSQLGSLQFHQVAATDQWQLLTTCNS
jgi:hypothetical protein